jgi:hypothetical protein
MAVVDKYGAKRGLQEAFPPVLSPAGFQGGRQRQILDGGAFANGDTVASRMFLGKVPSAAILSPQSIIYFGAFGTSCTLNIGDANDDDGLATLIAVASAGNSGILEAMTAQTYSKRLWEHLGYAKDPDTMIDLFAKLAGADVSTATAWMTWLLVYSND